jgi:hypothetical protein
VQQLIPVCVCLANVWQGLAVEHAAIQGTPKGCQPVYVVAACVVDSGVSLYAADIAIAVVPYMDGWSAPATVTVWLSQSFIELTLF